MTYCSHTPITRLRGFWTEQELHRTWARFRIELSRVQHWSIRPEQSSSEAAVSRSLGQAPVCADALGSGNWQLFDVVRDLVDHRRDAALFMMSRLTEALTSDEHVVALKPRLEELTRDAMRLLGAAAPAPDPVLPPGAETAPVPPPVVLPPAPPATWPEVVDEKQPLHLIGAAAVSALDELKTLVTSERDLELTLSWRVQRKGTQL